MWITDLELRHPTMLGLAPASLASLSRCSSPKARPVDEVTSSSAARLLPHTRAVTRLFAPDYPRLLN